jgi:hypothetical protein
MKCEECPLKYTRQTGREFKDRFTEHIRAIRTENSSSRYAQHKNNTEHSYSTIDQSLKILRIETKGQAINTCESCHVYTHVYIKQTEPANE